MTWFHIAPDEFNYAVGFDWAAHPRVTISADITGRRLRGFPFENQFGIEGTDGNVLRDDVPLLLTASDVLLSPSSMKVSVWLR